MSNKQPDGGYGWFVVLAGAIYSIIGGGLVRSFSLIILAIREKYNCTATQASWVYSVSTCVSLFTGNVYFVARLFKMMQ